MYLPAPGCARLLCMKRTKWLPGSLLGLTSQIVHLAAGCVFLSQLLPYYVAFTLTKMAGRG